MSEPAGGGVGILFIVFWCLYTPVYFGALYLAHKRKSIPPLRPRSYTLLVVGTFAGYLIITGAVFQTLFSTANFPCWLTLWLSWGVWPIYFIPYLLNAMRLIYLFNINREKLKAAESGEPVSALTKYLKFFHNRHRMSDSWLLKLLIFCIIPFLCYGFFEQFYHRSRWAAGNVGCDFTLDYYIAVLVLLVIFIGILFLTTVAMRDIEDEYNMNWELRLVCAVWVVLCIPYIAINLAEESSFKKKKTDTHYFVFFWCLTTACISLYYQLFRTYRDGREDKQWPGLKPLEHIDNLLADPQGIEAFKEFMTKEFAIENLLFYLEIKKFHKEIDGGDGVAPLTPEQLQTRVNEIYEKFIESDSVFEINITSNLKDAITAGLEHPTREIYDAAQMHVYQIMRTDSYPRFRKSPVAKALAQKLQKLEDLRKDLEDVNMA